MITRCHVATLICAGTHCVCEEVDGARSLKLLAGALAALGGAGSLLGEEV